MTVRRFAALAWLVLAVPSASGCLLALDETHYRDGSVVPVDATPGLDRVVPGDVPGSEGAPPPDRLPPPPDAVSMNDAPVVLDVPIGMADSSPGLDGPVGVDASLPDALPLPDVTPPGDSGPEGGISCHSDFECPVLATPCVVSVCVTGHCSTAPLDCDDGNVCTTDSCTPDTGCVNAPNTLPCGTVTDLCSVQACSGGTCSTTTMVACPAGQSCDPSTGGCRCPGGSLLCPDSSCRPAGGCCSNSECTLGQVCVANHCATCGLLGLFCCPGDACGSGLLCNPFMVPHVCAACGGSRQTCCPSTGGPQCTGSLHCVGGTCS